MTTYRNWQLLGHTIIRWYTILTSILESPLVCGNCTWFPLPIRYLYLSSPWYTILVIELEFSLVCGNCIKTSAQNGNPSQNWRFVTFALQTFAGMIGSRHETEWHERFAARNICSSPRNIKNNSLFSEIVERHETYAARNIKLVQATHQFANHGNFRRELIRTPDWFATPRLFLICNF